MDMSTYLSSLSFKELIYTTMGVGESQVHRASQQVSARAGFAEGRISSLGNLCLGF